MLLNTPLSMSLSTVKSFRTSRYPQGNSQSSLSHIQDSVLAYLPSLISHQWRLCTLKHRDPCSFSSQRLPCSVQPLITLPRHDTPDVSIHFVRELPLSIVFFYYSFLRAKISKGKNIHNLSIVIHCSKHVFVLTYAILKAALELIQLLPPFYR